MIWLIGEIWVWLLISAGAGAGVTALLGTRRVRTERWAAQSAPVADLLDARSLLEPEAREEPPRRPTPPPLASPFTEITGGARPWEDEEEWSKPVRRTEQPSPQAAAARPAAEAPSAFPFATPVDVVRERPRDVDDFPHAKPVEAERDERELEHRPPRGEL